MLRLFSAALLVASVLFTVTPAHAAGDIGVINIPKIMESSKAAQSVRKQLQDKQKSFQSQLDKKQKELLAEDQKLVKQQNSLSKDAFEKKVKEFQKRAEDAKKEIAEKRRQLDKGFTSALKQIEDKVIAIGEDVAKDKGYKVVISSAQILYSDSSLDITDVVLSRLNKELPKVKIAF